MGFIADMTNTDWWHEPALGFDPNLPSTIPALLVGWLGESLESVGNIDAELIDKIEWAYHHRSIDQGWMGVHECELCRGHYDRGEILIQTVAVNFIAPKMILHYIKVHRYRPLKCFSMR